MPKADRILANLPPTFRVLGDPSALRALVDAYGGELQTAENTLVSVMRAHWVDFADAGEPSVFDLARIGSLYGLAPRPDESVEEFRDHLKRYVKTFLEGTVTVRGLLRITAEALGLHIDERLDAWWDSGRATTLVDSRPAGTDAASLVLGVPTVDRIGRDAQPATLAGDVDLRAGVDLRARRTLRIALDGHGAVLVDLGAAAADPATATPAEIVDALNAQLPGVATVVGGQLRLFSSTVGPDGEVVVAEGPGDAAETVLGLRSRVYRGSDATHAQVTGTADLSTPADLTVERYLRVVVDDRLAEVDCAGSADLASAVDIVDIVAAINDALGIEAASHDGRSLTLTSPTPGQAGSIAFRAPAAQDATRRLFGQVPPFTNGTDARSATVVGQPDLGPGVDVSETPKLRLTVDAEPAETVDIVGVDPTSTTPAEIVSSINEGMGAPVASHDGSRVTLTSPTSGGTGSLAVEELPGDAAEVVLGLRPRTARGVLPTTASLTGLRDLAGRVDLAARYQLNLAVDGAPAVRIDLRRTAEDATRVRVDEIADAINVAVAGDVATDDGAHLILASETEGAGGRLQVERVTETRRRRFVTRAHIIDDAATTVFGFTSRRAVGSAATAARIVGDNDLSSGADLSSSRYLRLRIDDQAPLAVDCAGVRARATTPEQIVEQINREATTQVASTDGRAIALVSPTEGATSRLALEPPQDRDAIDSVLGVEPVFIRGTGATGVRFAGTVDLSAGVTLAADANLRLAVDAAGPVDVPVGDGVAAGTRSLSAVVAAINQTLVAQVAAHDGRYLLLSSPTTGATSRLEIGVPTSGTDVTEDLLGIVAPRTYVGAAPTAASVVGNVDLTDPLDLRTANLLTVRVDGGSAVIVDLASAGADAAEVTASQIATSINTTSDAIAATTPIPGGLSLRISSPSTGLSSRLEIGRSGAGDAAPLLFGSAGATAEGSAPTAATLVGAADLLAPADLSERSVLRLAVDGEEPVDIDVGGTRPQETLLAEIVQAINVVLPGVAWTTPDQRLRLVTRSEGPGSSVEVVPLRFLEVVEYPPGGATYQSQVAHGRELTFRNVGAAAVPARVQVATPVGVSGPRLADPSAGWTVRVDAAVGAGGAMSLEVVADGVSATIVDGAGARPVPGKLIHVTGTDQLVVRRGANRWIWSECQAARFDAARFDMDWFAGGPCSEDAVFDLSSFGPTPARAVFAAAGSRSPTADVTVHWVSHAAGALEVNLPEELDRRFGGAFGEVVFDETVGETRFGTATPERYLGVVTEPTNDPNYIEQRINVAKSRLIEAALVPAVPIGWAAVTMPFRAPTHLTLGRRDTEARLYLTEPGLAPMFLLLRAAEPGEWGNDITVTCRASGPAIYDLEVSLAGGRFENARAVVFGPPLPTLADALLAPGAVGVGTAKAAGIHVNVTRDRASEPAEEEPS